MPVDDNDKLANLAADEMPRHRTLRVESEPTPRLVTLRVEQGESAAAEQPDALDPEPPPYMPSLPPGIDSPPDAPPPLRDETPPYAPPPSSGTLRVEQDYTPGPSSGTLRVEETPPGTREVEDAAPRPSAAPHIRILAHVDPGTQLFGQYTVVRTIQEHEHDQPGIFLVTDRESQTIVLKVHPRDYAPDREVHSKLPALRHPNVIRTFSYGETDGYHYEAQEYCTGGTVAQLVPQPGTPVTPERVNWVFYEFLPQVHAGLCYMHEQSIVHRDLKPSNIYIRREASGPMYILGDFDISSTLEQTRSSRLTQRTWLTLEYAAPEQFPQLSAQGGRLAARISRKCDYWSLAITLLELLVGTTTLHQIGPELVQGFHMKGRRVELPDGLPESVALLLRGLLIRDDELRWGGAEVTRWLKRQTTTADKAQIERDMAYAGYQAVAPYRLEEETADDLRELARAMARKPAVALEDYLGGEALLNWVAQQDTNMARELRRDRDRWRSKPEVALQCAIQKLDPRQPFVFADGSTAVTFEQWGEQATRLSRAEGRQRLDLSSLALHDRLAVWLKLKDPPEPELAQSVQELAGHPPAERTAELLFLLQPARPLEFGDGLQAHTPDEFVKLAYGKPEDWRKGAPACYGAALGVWRDGTLAAWLRQRGNKEAAYQCGEAAKAFADYPSAGFETALRILDPRLAKVKVACERRAIPHRLYVPYGDVRVLELSFRTEGPGIPFGALTQSEQMPGVSLDEHILSERSGKLEVRFVGGTETVGSKTYTGALVLDSGVAELVGGPLKLRYFVGFPHQITAQRVLLGALAGAFLLGFPRFVAWLMGLNHTYHWSQLDITKLWDDAISLRFTTANIVLLMVLLALAGILAWRLWINAMREAEP